MKLKTNVMGLLYNAAGQVKRRDAGTAYALLELANNLRVLMRGEASLDEWREIYVGQDREPFDLDALLPVEAS